MENSLNTNIKYKEKNQYKVASIMYKAFKSFFHSYLIPHTSYLKLFIFSFILSASYFIPSAAEAAFRMPPNNLGLVGYWAMNDATGTKATDYSGNGNTGTLTNGPTWGAGKRGGAVVFDGTNDYVNVPDANSLDISSTITMAAWVKPGTATGAHQVILRKGDNTSASNYTIYLSSAGGSLGYYNGANLVVSTATPTVGQWTHVVVTVSGTTALFYMNGLLADTVTVASGVGATNSHSLYIGSTFGTIEYFSGSLDEVRIYNRALTAPEVTTLYNSGVTKLNQGSANGLVGHWKLDDASGTKATDSSGSGNTGTLTNFALSGAVSNWINGKHGGALDFDGTNDYIDTGTSATLKPADFTFSTWVKYDVLTNYMSIASTSADPAGYANGWVLEGRDSPYVLRLFVAGTAATNPTQIQTGVWYHVVSKYVTSTNTKTLYVNGVAGTPVSSGSTLSYVGDNPFSIGAQRTGPTSAYPNQTWYPFNGQIDESRLYNRALTDAEITTLYNSGAVTRNASTAGRGGNLTSGLVGHWTFDGSKLTTSTATDSSGGANNGTLTNGPVPAQGKLGQALSFDGTDDYVTVPHSASLALTTNLTVSLWIKDNSLSSDKVLLAKSSTSGADRTFWFYENGGIRWSYFNTLGPIIPSASITDGAWHHIVGTFDGITLVAYLDGVQTGTPTATTPIADNSAAIGINAYVGGTNLAGAKSLDDVRIYNRVLTTAEVLQLYNLR